MSSMDSELVWGESSQNDEHNCGPDSGMVLPMVYNLDPAQVRHTCHTFRFTFWLRRLPGACSLQKRPRPDDT